MSCPGDFAAPMTDSKPSTNRWFAYGLPLAVILVFAACIFDFATLKKTHLPAHKRVNNGWTPTFFAFHISPSYNFSEDFHLYYVRAKRIERRGWTDSLFYSRPDAKTCYSAPLQVMIGRLALLTEGAPRRYAVFMFAILGTAWSMLYFTARHCLPREVASATILFAVLITVLFEALHLIYTPPRFESFGQWPTYRALRMSTMSWTSPMLLAVLITLSSLLYDRARWGKRVAALGVMLALLLGTDNWAFAMAWFGTGITGTWIAAQALFRWFRTPGPDPTGRRDASMRGLGEGEHFSGALARNEQRIASSLNSPERTAAVGQSAVDEAPRKSVAFHPSLFRDFRLLFAAGAIMLVALVAHDRINGSLAGDALLRGGMGPEWTDALDRDTNVDPMKRWFFSYAIFPLFVIGLLSIVELRRSRSDVHGAPEYPETNWAQFRALAILPVVAAVAINTVLHLRGMECYLRSQLYWRADYCLLFVLVLTVGEWIRTSLPALSARLAQRWALLISLALASLFAYHVYRTHWFVKHTARRDFFLTADLQGLQPWLEKFDREHPRYELATPSLELNYMAAFWTNADLLLPSGFPYHNGATNKEIEERAVAILRLYNTSRDAWLQFTMPTAERFQDLWLQSRVRAAGRGYMYHLFHRWAYAWFEGQPFWGEVARQDIANILATPAETWNKPSPEVILIDDVSRALGTPDLANYRLMHRSGAIEAWVRSDVAVP